MNRLPRVTRNTSNGVGPRDVAVDPPPSQLISRRPAASGPGALPLLGAPSAARNASTVPWMDATLGPAAWNTIGVTGSSSRSWAWTVSKMRAGPTSRDNPAIAAAPYRNCVFILLRLLFEPTDYVERRPIVATRSTRASLLG